MKPAPWSVASLTVIAVCLWQAADTLGRMPAFNPALRVETVTGGTRPALREAAYHRGEYLYQSAYDWRAMTAEEVLHGGVAVMPAPEVLHRRAEIARDLFTASLRETPANASAWMALAAAQYDLGNHPAMLQALRVSLDLAPYDPRLTFRRLVLLGRISARPPGDAHAAAALSPEIVEQVVEALAHRFEFDLNPVRRVYPELGALIDSTLDDR